MYQLASNPVDKTRLFIDTCTSMALGRDTLGRDTLGRDTLGMVSSTTALMRTALATSDLTPLHAFTRTIEARGGDVDDVFAAAGQALLDEFDHAPRATLHDTIRRVAQIERDVLAARFGIRRDLRLTTLAG